MQIGDYVKVAEYSEDHGILVSRFRSAGIEWANVLIPDQRVGYQGRITRHPVQSLVVVTDVPTGWIDDAWRR